jgi:hypothetical protein
MLEDPRLNFAISKRSAKIGIEHLGIQVEDEQELYDVYGRLSRAERPVLEEKGTTCCYAQSDKQWIADPQGVAWETFLTHGPSTVYGKAGAVDQLEHLTGPPDSPCCVPSATKLSTLSELTAPPTPSPSCGCGSKA